MKIFQVLRKYIERKKFAKYPCEEVLGNMGAVSSMGLFYDNNKDELEYLELLFKTKFPEENLFSFLKKCSKEEKIYKKKQEAEKERVRNKVSIKSLRKKAF
ncbi:MAG: hypothetical protein U9R15_04815 [Chloroflexota bacterium]|nr:hypothetical protein [Chloroflexota bacterium]